MPRGVYLTDADRALRLGRAVDPRDVDPVGAGVEVAQDRGRSLVVTRTIGVTPRGSTARHRFSTSRGWRVPCSPSKTRKSQPCRPTYSMRLWLGGTYEAAEHGLARGQLRLGRFSSIVVPGQSILRLMTSSHRSDRPRAGHRGGDGRVGERVVEARAVRPPGGHRPEELERLDELEVLVAERVPATRDDVALVRERVPGQDLDEAVVGLLLGEVEPELVELFVIPRCGALRPVELEGHRALRPEDRAVGLERAADAACRTRRAPRHSPRW